MNESYPVTPDGRYFVVRGRLWRTANPYLDDGVRQQLVKNLMAARWAVKKAVQVGDSRAEWAARSEVDDAKHQLGERGPVWWKDGQPDYNRCLANTTPYAEWWDARQ